MVINSNVSFGIALFATVTGIVGIILAVLFKSDDSSSSTPNEPIYSNFLEYDGSTLASVNRNDESLTFTVAPSINITNVSRETNINNYQFPKESPEVGDTVVVADASGTMVFKPFGNVQGPPNANLNRVATFATTTGDTLLNSSVVIDTNGEITGVSGIIASSTITAGGFSVSGMNSSYRFPDADGVTNQFITTDGNGKLSWSTPVGAAGGNVVGPISSVTDEAVVIYNSTSGTAIKNSNTTISTDGTVKLNGNAIEAKLEMINGKLTHLETSDIVGKISLSGPYNNTAQTYTAGYIECEAMADWGLNSNSSRLTIGVANSSGAVEEALSLGPNKSNGLVGSLWIEDNLSGSSESSAVLTLTSTTQGFLPPRMTTIQRDTITSPATGLMVYNTTTNKLNFYNGTTWIEL